MLAKCSMSHIQKFNKGDSFQKKKKSYLENLAKLSMLRKNSKIPIRLTLKMGFAYQHINRMVIPAKLQFDMF